MTAEISVPAEFERQSTALIAVDELLPHHPHVLTALVSALVDRLQVIAVITGEEQRRELLTILCDWGMPAHRIHTVRSLAFASWLRRDRPLFIRRGGQLRAACAGGTDEGLAGELSALLDAELYEPPAAVGSGELLSNGRGLGLTTAAWDREAAGAIRTQFGLRHLAVLPQIDRLDRLATFVDTDMLVLARLDRRDDAAAAGLLDRAADALRGVDSGAGPLKVERLPMPPRRDPSPRSYADVVFANGAVVVPSYSDTGDSLEDEVMETYCRLLQGREVVAVDATSLAAAGVALRSVALSVPPAARWSAAERRARPADGRSAREGAFVTRQGWYGPRRSVLRMDA